MKASVGEVYTVYNQYLKRYTACQVAYIAPPDTVSEESWAVILSMNWVGDALPDSILRKNILIDKFEELRDF